MKNTSLSIENFKQFQLNNITHVKGGIGGTITGSSQSNGRSYVDVSWDNGDVDCDLPAIPAVGESDGINDTLLGSRLNP